MVGRNRIVTMRRARRRVLGAAAVVLAGVGVAAFALGYLRPAWDGRLSPGSGRVVAPGVTLYRPDAAADPDLPVPLAVRALAIDPMRADVTAALALGGRQGRATVADAARREHAVAAVNAGFFVLASGDPTGALRVDGRLVSDARLPRGAVAIAPVAGRLRLTFARVKVRAALELFADGSWQGVPLDGVDTVRHAGGLTLYTSRFGPDSGTPAVGVEWPVTFVDAPVTDLLDGVATRTIAGSVAGRVKGGRTPIPGEGAVLSFGGAALPPALERLAMGHPIRIRETWQSDSPADAAAFAAAEDVVGGAGLLVKDGRPIDDWSVERTSGSLQTARHPRTMIGADARGAIWLVTVDGRQPGYSVGLTLPELRRLALGLGLTDALNLDGGGSTTMVVENAVVNRPSDATGPRAVSDVLLVRSRPGRPPAAPR